MNVTPNKSGSTVATGTLAAGTTVKTGDSNKTAKRTAKETDNK